MTNRKGERERERERERDGVKIRKIAGEYLCNVFFPATTSSENE